MKRFFVVGLLLSASLTFAQTIPELFGKAKEEIKAGSWADASKTLDALEAEASKPGNEGVRKQLDAPLAFYRGVCAANLGKSDEAVASFGAFLKLQPNASIDKAVYSKKAVADFEKAQKAAAEQTVSLADAYKQFTPLQTSETVDQYWGDGPVRWIMTADETKTWASLTDPNARVDFVEKFWAARVALPGADGRTYRQEFERRAAFADTNLPQDAEKRGSLTDRGMVFILLGAPNWAARKPMRTRATSRTSRTASRRSDPRTPPMRSAPPAPEAPPPAGLRPRAPSSPDPERARSERTRTRSRPGTTGASSFRPAPRSRSWTSNF